MWFVQISSTAFTETKSTAETVNTIKPIDFLKKNFLCEVIC